MKIANDKPDPSAKDERCKTIALQLDIDEGLTSGAPVDFDFESFRKRMLQNDGRD